ncbi:MAG: hypothetical protein GAK34_02582 [Delftia tsuruhatensis]|nr:MAG: hypothetical protein GAK34_02582 [Delftia tsuruhatensis]
MSTPVPTSTTSPTSPTSTTSQWSDPLIITVAPNGAYKQPADHRALPVTPQALAARWA